MRTSTNTVTSLAPEECTVLTHPPAPGVVREQAFAAKGFWFGKVTTKPGSDTGWHHHGDHDTYAFVLAGIARIEWGDGEAIELAPGSFGHMPGGVPHRESNPGTEANELLLVRLGGIGPMVVPVQRD